jgi:hypothetical protein
MPKGDIGDHAPSGRKAGVLKDERHESRELSGHDRGLVRREALADNFYFEDVFFI